MINKTIPETHHKKLQQIGALLRETRIGNGYSQEGLTEYLNLHRNSIVHAENAKNITLLTIFELADTLKIDLKDLFWDIK
jgi:DNA-binding XRE family transcriptional regulator